MLILIYGHKGVIYFAFLRYASDFDGCSYRPGVPILRISLKCPALKPINLETMTYPFSHKDKYLSAVALMLLLTATANAVPGDFFSQSSPFPHISPNCSLYTCNEEAGLSKKPDTAGIKHTHTTVSGYIRKNKNNDLVIAIPDAQSAKYKVRFYDGNTRFLFEIKQIRDAMLIVEKLNFQHAGLFQYELYKGDLLVEKNMFVIKKD
jgi:hypothetical protein